MHRDTYLDIAERMKFLSSRIIILRFNLVLDVDGIGTQYETNYTKAGVIEYNCEDHLY